MVRRGLGTPPGLGTRRTRKGGRCATLGGVDRRRLDHDFLRLLDELREDSQR